MINAKRIEDIAKQVTDAIPPSLKNIASDFEEKTKSILQKKIIATRCCHSRRI